MKTVQKLVITLPFELGNIPVTVVKKTGPKRIVLDMESLKNDVSLIDEQYRKYVFVWKQNNYRKVAFDDIIWIKADRSYSIIHISERQDMIVSSNLAVVEKELPASDFIRIHRSCIVNLKHVDALVGNCLKIGDELFAIGREYREKLLDRFIFIGVRKSQSR